MFHAPFTMIAATVALVAGGWMPSAPRQETTVIHHPVVSFQRHEAGQGLQEDPEVRALIDEIAPIANTAVGGYIVSVKLPPGVTLQSATIQTQDAWFLTRTSSLGKTVNLITRSLAFGLVAHELRNLIRNPEFVDAATLRLLNELLRSSGVRLKSTRTVRADEWHHVDGALRVVLPIVGNSFSTARVTLRLKGPAGDDETTITVPIPGPGARHP